MNIKKAILIMVVIAVCVILYINQIPVELRSTISEDYLSDSYSLEATIKRWNKDDLSSEDLEPINNQEVIGNILEFILKHEGTATIKKTFNVDPGRQVYLSFRDNKSKKYMDIYIIGENYVLITTYDGNINENKYVIRKKINIDYLIELLSSGVKKVAG